MATHGPAGGALEHGAYIVLSRRPGWIQGHESKAGKDVERWE